MKDLFLINHQQTFCYICGKETKFRNKTYGFEHFCSKECRSIYQSSTHKGNTHNLGRKQSQERIQKRVQNTNQIKKEEKRKRTCLEKWDVDNPSNIEDVKEKIKETHTKNGTSYGKPVNSEIAYKIAESKRKNGTNKHSEKSKQKMSEKIKESYVRRYKENPKYKKKIGNSSFGISGNYNGIFYRSSYELKFLQLCFKYDIKVVSAENSQYSTTYLGDDNKFHTYHPDFYLPDYGLIIEIKSYYYLEKDTETINLKLLSLDKPFLLLTEEDIFDKNENFIKEIIEYN